MGNITTQTESDGIYFVPICNSCINSKMDGSCFAFPKGIPEKILTGEHDHTKPFPGDNGIRFEPIKVQKTKG